MPKPNANRRQLLGAVILLPFAPLAQALMPTPSGAQGPFYPTASMRFDDVDNDLVKIEGSVREAGGEIVRVTGQLVDTEGEPLAGASVEIWQCDATGRYLHTADRQASERDPGFQGFGRDVTDAQGRFSFRTIKPVPYPGRTPHIHLKVIDQGFELLTTQLYLKDHPENTKDFLFQRMSRSQQQQVSIQFNGSVEPLAEVRLVVSG